VCVGPRRVPRGSSTIPQIGSEGEETSGPRHGDNPPVTPAEGGQ
jgi:hypothetical protein